MRSSRARAATETGRADETDDAQWRDAMHANLDTAFVSARACLPDLIAQRGSIVLVASIAALAAGPACAATRSASTRCSGRPVART